ncbi:MAG: response regulator [Acidobacteria bacterium]|nr:response regulator [Acidobacteriota bacterium]
MANVFAVVDDLFFIGKLAGTAKQVGATLQTTSANKFSLETLREVKPALVIFDLNAGSASAVELIRQLKADAELAATPVIGFFSHVQVELMRAAEQAGCNEVMPRSKFTATLADILQRASAPSL